MMRGLAGFVVVLTGAWLAAPLAAAPQAIHYQGYLTNADGNPLDETVEMEFRLYDVEVAGEAFWSTPEAIAVDVESGVFRVNLAPVTAEQFASGDVWLGITVIPADPGEPAQEMEPRLKVLSVPYALVAEHAATADVAGEAAAVTNVDFSTFATGDDVQGVLGLCIQEADLVDALQGYCASPCYGDADVELFVTENGYVTLTALVEWAEQNISVGLHEDALAAYLAANGYMTEADLLWFLGEAGFLKTEDLAGLGYAPGPHYTDGDVETLLATKNYCQDPCFSGSYNDLADKPSLDGHDADTVDGFDTNATGQAVAQTIPITDENGKIPQELLPFSKGDLLAPADRQLVQGLDEYDTGYFSIDELGIEGNVAANVKEGVKFGPGKAVMGALQGDSPYAWWETEGLFVPHDDFAHGVLSEARWTWEYAGNVWYLGCLSPDASVSGTSLARGETGELVASDGAQAESTVAFGKRSLFFRYFVEHALARPKQALWTQAASAVSVGGVNIAVEGQWEIGIGLARESGFVELRWRHDDIYDVYRNGSRVATGMAFPGGPQIGIQSGCWCELEWSGCQNCLCASAGIDDVRVSATSESTEKLSCDDFNPCTADYFGGDTEGDCVHEPVVVPCDDGSACTTGDVCDDGECAGLPADCDDGIPETTDDCDPGVGCVNETCPVNVFDFTTGADGWQLGGDWVWDEAGWLQGFGSTGALVSKQFSKTSSKLKVRYKCLGDGGLVFAPGPDVPCKYDGVWVEDFVDLGGATWLVQVTHYGAGSVLIDKVEVLEPCQ